MITGLGRSPSRASGFDVNHWSVMLAVVLIAAVISAFLLVAPAVVGALVNTIGFTPAQAGYLLSIELAAMGIVVPPAFWWMPRWDWRRVGAACLLLAALGNAASVFARSFMALAVLRAMTGVAAGSLIVVCSATVAMTHARERNYGFFVVGQLVLGMFGVKFLPGLVARHGLMSLYGTLALFTIVLVPLTVWLPPAGAAANPARHVESAKEAAQWRDTRGLMGLGCILCFYVALSAVWAYLERIGAYAGFRGEAVANVLALASLFGVFGALAASALGGRWGRPIPICLGYAILIGAIGSLFHIEGDVRFYMFGSCSFKFAWTFALPFVLATLASRDPTGRLIVVANLCIIVGLAAGPTLAALTLQQSPNYSGVLAIGIVMGAISLALALPVAWGFPGERTPPSGLLPVARARHE